MLQKCYDLQNHISDIFQFLQKDRKKHLLSQKEKKKQIINQITSYKPKLSLNYFSNVNQPWFTSASANSVLMPYKATLIGYHINYIVNGTLGSSETATLQITASGSSTNILTSLTFSDVANSYTSSATSINVSAGDLISARLNTPTWGTPPTNIRMGITFLFVRRP